MYFRGSSDNLDEAEECNIIREDIFIILITQMKFKNAMLSAKVHMKVPKFYTLSNE